MDAALSLAAGSGWASGISLYGVVVMLGILQRTGTDSIPDVFARPEVMAIAGGLYAIEFVVDKVPYLDNLWDAVHTAIRPIGAAVVGAALVGETAELNEAIGAATSGTFALGAHSTKAALRLAINTSPEPASNIATSLVEDGAVAALIWLALEHPLVAGALAIMLLFLGAVVVVASYRLVRAGLRKVRARVGRFRPRHLSGTGGAPDR